VDSDPKMKVLRFVPDLYSRKLSHHFELRQHGWMHRLDTLSCLLYLAVREIRGILVLVDQLGIPIFNINIGNTKTKNKKVLQYCTNTEKSIDNTSNKNYIAILTTLLTSEGWRRRERRPAHAGVILDKERKRYGEWNLGHPAVKHCFSNGAKHDSHTEWAWSKPLGNPICLPQKRTEHGGGRPSVQTARRFSSHAGNRLDVPRENIADATQYVRWMHETRQIWYMG